MKYTKYAFIAIMCCVFTSLVYAQTVPPLVNYQGWLTDENGQPLNGTRKLTFNYSSEEISHKKDLL